MKFENQKHDGFRKRCILTGKNLPPTDNNNEDNARLALSTKRVTPMPKEDRSDWVAVAPEYGSSAPKIKPPVTAFQFYQRDVTDEVKAKLIAQHGKFEVGLFSRAVRDHWNQIEDERREYYEELARNDQARYAQESHAADVAAMERRARLQQERATLLLDDEGGNRRTTRGRQKRKERKKERKEKKQQQQEQRQARAKQRSFDDGDDDEEFVDEDDESSDSYEEESDESEDSYDSDDSDQPRKQKAKKRAPAPKRPQSQKQIEYRERMQREKKEKEEYIVERQEDIRKEKAAQAKRRLEFLLKQSDIFSHFGKVKQDQAKYGIKITAPASEDGTNRNRRDAVATDGQLEEELDEADEHQATYLTSQPTTMAFGKMRPYQLEGLKLDDSIAGEWCQRYSC